MNSQGTRERDASATESDSSSSPTPLKRKKVFLGLFLDDVDDVIDGENTDQPAVVVDDGRGEQVILLEELGCFFLVHLGRDGVAGVVHDRIDLDRTLGAQHAVEINGSQQLEGGIDDEDLREALGQVLIFAHVVDRLADRPERRHRHELGLHAASGRALGIVERAAKANPFREGKLRQDLVLVFLVEVFENVDGVVRIHLADGRGDLFVRQMLDDVETDGFVDLRQRRKVKLLAKQ